MSKVLKAVTKHSLFGPPLVVEGEDAAAYDELFGRVCAAVKPTDVIEEMLVADLVALEWELLPLQIKPNPSVRTARAERLSGKTTRL